MWPAKHNISITLSGICPSVRQVVVVTLTYILGDTTVCVKSLWIFFKINDIKHGSDTSYNGHS